MFQGGRTAGQAGPQEQAHRKEDPGGAPGIGGGKSGVFFLGGAIFWADTVGILESIARLLDVIINFFLFVIRHYLTTPYSKLAKVFKMYSCIHVRSHDFL
jgi:hypothetical protein